MPLYFVSHALLLYAVRTGCRSQHMVCSNLKERVHGRTGAPDTDMGTFPLKKTASTANLILHVKNVCFLVSAFFQGRYSKPRDLARNDAVFPTSLTHLLRVPVSEFANKGTACSRI